MNFTKGDIVPFHRHSNEQSGYVYLISQLTLPVAMINERLSEGQEPGDFHFMRYVRCLDVGVECLGFGEVMMKVNVVPRSKLP